MTMHEVNAYFAAMAVLTTVSTVVSLVAIIVALRRRIWWPLWLMLCHEILDLLNDKHVAILHLSTSLQSLSMGISTLGICALTFKLAEKEK